MIRTLFSSLFFVLVFSTPTMAGPRAAVDVKCEPMEAKLNYHCMIKLMNRKTKEPIPDAMIMIKADMPSMPMAHNVPPVHAAKGAMPGHYEAHLHLEMHGNWALTMDISGPLKDRVITKLNFGGPMAMKHDHGKMDHSKHGKMDHSKHGKMDHSKHK